VGAASWIDYNTEDRALGSFDFKTIDMTPIAPDTIYESLYKIVCKGKKK
jgi:hypothetical protein